MNKELIVLTDELMLVRNETGEYEKREYISNAKEILLQENKIEIVTNHQKIFTKNYFNYVTIIYSIDIFNKCMF